MKVSVAALQQAFENQDKYKDFKNFCDSLSKEDLRKIQDSFLASRNIFD